MSGNVVIGVSFKKTSFDDTPDSISIVQQHMLQVKDVNYHVKQYIGSWWSGCCLRKRLERQIISDVSLVAHGGQLTALLGNSGSGKTTLLDIISCRIKGQLSGEVLFNGRKLTQQHFQHVAGYVMQQDRLLPNLTVKELITYSAELAFAGTKDKHFIKEKVKEVMHDMGILNISDSRIGGVFLKGIQNGEKRRVSIAIQLLKDPDLLLLDEPTTGLDSYTAHHLVASLSEMARRKNRIILMSIHQPRSDVFPMFSSIGILSQGQLVYYGPGTSMIQYFTQLGYPCSQYANPLDRYIDVSSYDHRSAELEHNSNIRIKSLVQQYKDSSIHKNVNSVTPVCQEWNGKSQDKHWSFCQTCVANFWIVTVLLRRMSKNILRDRGAVLYRSLTCTVFVFFMWVFLIRLKNDLRSVQNRLGILYQSVAIPPMVGVLVSVSLFPTTRDLYYRESRDGLYGSFPLLVAYVIHCIPFQVVSVGGFAVWMYWGLGLYPSAERFFIYYFTCLILYHIGEMMTITLLAIIRSPFVSESAAVLIISSNILYATGIFRSKEAMLKILQWLAWVSPWKYASELVVSNEFHKLNITCEGSGLPCKTIPGDLFLEVLLPGSQNNHDRNFAALSGFVVGLWILFYVVLKIVGIKNLH